MKIYINGNVYDSTKDTIVLIFENDEMRKVVAKNIMSMPKKEGVRMYAEFSEAQYTGDEAQELFLHIKSKYIEP